MRYFSLFLLLMFNTISVAQNALHFDGSDDYIQAPNPGPVGNSPRTVEAWINISGTSSSQEVIVDWGDMAIGNRWTLNIINGVPRIEVGGSGFNAPAPLSTGVWHHLAASYNGSSVSFFIDGVLVTSGAFSVPVNTSNLNGIIIGRRNDSINNFEGLIDEVRVWNVARTAIQISSNMNKEICLPATGLVAYYNFNQGIAGGVNTTVNILNDISGSNNNGNLFGFGLAGGVSNWVTGKSLSTNSASTISPTACQSYISPAGNTYTVSGTYVDTLTNTNGCDSVITINLTVNSVDTSVTQNGNTLTSGAVGATYQWIDCNNGNQNIPGQTNAMFTTQFNGSYSVSVTQNGCTATSSCYAVTNVGIDEDDEISISIYPNPLYDELFVVAGDKITDAAIQIKLTDITGQVALSSVVQNTGTIVLDLKNISPGIYTLELSGKKSFYLTKIVKR